MHSLFCRDKNSTKNWDKFISSNKTPPPLKSSHPHVLLKIPAKRASARPFQPERATGAFWRRQLEMS